MGVETEAEYGGSDMSFMSAILVIEGTCICDSNVPASNKHA